MVSVRAKGYKGFSQRENAGDLENVGTHRMRPSEYVCRFSHSGDVVDGVGDEGGGYTFKLFLEQNIPLVIKKFCYIFIMLVYLVFIPTNFLSYIIHYSPVGILCFVFHFSNW